MGGDKTFDYQDSYEESPGNIWMKVVRNGGDVYRYKIVNGEPSSEGEIIYKNGGVYKGKFDKDRPSKGTMNYADGRCFVGEWIRGKIYFGNMLYKDGIIFDGFWENDQLFNGKKIFKNGTVLHGKFDKNGQFFEGEITCYDGKTIECTWKNSQISVGNLNYIFSNVFENELDENGQPLDKVRIIFRDGNVFEGKLDKDGRHSVGKMMFIKGDVYDGEFKDGKLYRGKLTYINNTVLEGDFDENSQFCKGKKTQSDGIVLDGSWENNKPLDISVIAKLSKTGKAYCLFKRGKNNFQREIEYHLDGIDGHNRVMTIDYERINEILDGKGGEINNLDDLVKSEAINGVNNFNELKDFAKKMFQDRMSGEIKNGLEGLCIPLCDLLLLSSVDTVEQLKKTRFQHYTRKNEDSLRKDYGSLKDLLESVDINSIDEVEEDYLSLRIATIPTTHGISVILDIKKMKELKNLKPGRSLDEAVADKKVIHCFDSSRVLGANVGKKHNMGALTKNCDFVNLTQQELGSCWFHAMASTLTAMKYPELVQKIRNEKIELYDTEHKSIREGDKLNEFQLKQMNTIREISEKFNIGFIDDNREAIDLIIRSDVKEKVMEEPLRDVSEEVLGTKMVNVIKKMRDRLERSEIVPIQPIKTNLETVSARRKRETDFAHRVRITGEQDRTVKVLREDPEKSEKIILKELEAQRNFLTKNGKKRGIDDNVVHYGKGNEYDTLVSKLKKKRISSEMERQV